MSIQKIADVGIGWSAPQTRPIESPTPQTSSATPTGDSGSVAQANNADKGQNGNGEQDAQQAAAAMQEFIQPLNNTLKFSVDQDSGQTIVKVVDTSTDTVIKQIPSEEAIALAKALDKLKGLLIQQKA